MVYNVEMLKSALKILLTLIIRKTGIRTRGVQGTPRLQLSGFKSLSISPPFKSGENKFSVDFNIHGFGGGLRDIGGSSLALGINYCL